jgi:hypothetical protein
MLKAEIGKTEMSFETAVEMNREMHEICESLAARTQ